MANFSKRYFLIKVPGSDLRVCRFLETTLFFYLIKANLGVDPNLSHFIQTTKDTK